MTQQAYFEQCLGRIRFYLKRASGKLESGQSRDLAGSLADVAELAEISRRFYNAIALEIRMQKGSND